MSSDHFLELEHVTLITTINQRKLPLCWVSTAESLFSQQQEQSLARLITTILKSTSEPSGLTPQQPMKLPVKKTAADFSVELNSIWTEECRHSFLWLFVQFFKHLSLILQQETNRHTNLLYVLESCRQQNKTVTLPSDCAYFMGLALAIEDWRWTDKWIRSGTWIYVPPTFILFFSKLLLT